MIYNFFHFYMFKGILINTNIIKIILIIMEEIKSPCRSICKYDLNRICIGCYRTSKEIVDWITMTNDEKLSTLDAIEKRKSDSSFGFIFN